MIMTLRQSRSDLAFCLAIASESEERLHAAPLGLYRFGGVASAP
jgi:hypothetical protein